MQVSPQTRAVPPAHAHWEGFLQTGLHAEEETVTPSFYGETFQWKVVVFQSVNSVSPGGMSSVGAEVKEAWSLGCPQSDRPAAGWEGPAGRMAACHHAVCPCLSPWAWPVGDIPHRLLALRIFWPGRRTQAVVDRQTRPLFV